MDLRKRNIYGIGNPLIDILVDVDEQDLTTLGIHKGTMALIDRPRMDELLSFAKTKDVAYDCGGSCPNTIMTLAALGVDTTLAGKLGNDGNGTIYHDSLKAFSMGNDLVFTDEEATGSTVILITPDSERSMNTFLGANRYFSQEDIVERHVKQADCFHFTGYMWDTEKQKEAIRKALDIASDSKTIISFALADPFAVGRYGKIFLSLIADHCDIVFAKHEEARILFDNYDPRACCQSMGKLCRTAIVKNGKKGSHICHEGSLMDIPAMGPVVPVDTTGAGDIYAAGFLYGLSRDFDIKTSGMIASLLAGRIICRHGARFSPSAIQELKTMIAQKAWEAFL